MKMTFWAWPALLLALATIKISAAEEKAVVDQGKINVRGQPSLYSETVTQLKKGDEVTVLEYVSAQKPKAGEPTNWAKIKLPPNTPVWVYAPLLKDHVVSGSKVNLRAGPGENYSVLGRISKGAPVKELRTEEDWAQIEPPEDAYAFVDADLLKKSEPAPAKQEVAKAPAETPKESAPAPTILAPAPAIPLPTPITNETKVAEAPTPVPPKEEPKPEQTVASVPPKEEPKPEPKVTVAEPVKPPTVSEAPKEHEKTPEISEKDKPKPRRVVRREGIIKGTFSIQAPTYFELVNPQTKKAVNYLHAEKSGIKLKDVKGIKVAITGEEFIDPRWPNTPVIEIETLEPVP